MSASHSEPMGARNWEPDFTPRFEVREEVINEVITGEQKPCYYKEHEPYFPTICVCMVCNGITGCCDLKHGELKMTKEEAFILACVQHGVYMEKWKDMNCGNSFNFPKLCQCACHHQWKETMRPPTSQSGLHRSKCVKCGIEMEYDTSD